MQLPSFLLKRVSVSIRILVFAGLAAYGVWEFYWYKQVGLTFNKWHTHLALFVYVWVAGALLIGLRGNTNQRNNILTAFSAVLMTLFLAEAGLMILGTNKTYSESRNGIYVSLFSNFSNDSLRTYGKNVTHALSTPEYNFERKTNAHGFSDQAFEPKGAKILIQTYGDSFTEGDGAPSDSSYPAILRTFLGDGFTVQNYGICGNDPGFYVPQFGKVGASYNPDLIVLCYGTGDLMMDMMSRGGLERFTMLGWHTREGPWWEVVYAISHVSRVFFHAAETRYDNFFMSDAEMVRQLRLLENSWTGVFAEIARLAEINQTQVLLIKKPERAEIALNQYQYDMAFFDKFLMHHPVFRHVDLMHYYNQQGLVSHQTTAPYYWPIDGHHNATGYAAMAKGVYDALKSEFPEYWE